MGAKTGSDELVTVREVLGAGANMFFLDQTGAKVVEDWRGEPCVSVADAQRAVAATKAAEEEATHRQREFDAYLADRDRKRAEAGEKAVAKALPKLLRAQQEEMLGSGTTWDNSTITMAGQRPTPGTSEALRQVRREAIAAFDRKHPAKELEDF